MEKEQLEQKLVIREMLTKVEVRWVIYHDEEENAALVVLRYELHDVLTWGEGYYNQIG